MDSSLEGNPLSLNASHVESQIMPSQTSACAAAAAPLPSSFDKRSDRLENMFGKLIMTQMETTPPTQCVTCEHCGKKGHEKECCFKLKKCYSCGRMGHIGKFRKSGKGEGDHGATELSSNSSCDNLVTRRTTGYESKSRLQHY